jgi:hypothetical protein
MNIMNEPRKNPETTPRKWEHPEIPLGFQKRYGRDVRLFNGGGCKGTLFKGANLIRLSARIRAFADKLIKSARVCRESSGDRQARQISNKQRQIRHFSGVTTFSIRPSLELLAIPRRHLFLLHLSLSWSRHVGVDLLSK